MKKLALLSLVILPLCACDKSDNKATPADFAVVQAALDANPPAEIITAGQMGDFTVYVPASDELNAVYAKQKDSKFLSAELNPSQHVKEGSCIIDVVSQKAMEDMGTPENTCFYRLFCGSADTNIEELYSVTVCKE